MTSAFLFFNCEAKYMEAIKNELRKIDHIVYAYETSGIYDIVAKVDTRSEETLRDVVAQTRILQGVTCTTTTKIAKGRLSDPK